MQALDKKDKKRFENLFERLREEEKQDSTTTGDEGQNQDTQKN